MTGVVERTFRVTLKLHPEDVARSPLIQTVKGVRCIPGTTYKGAVRASMENWFRQLASQGARALTPCVPVAESALSKDEQRLVDSHELRVGCAVQVRNRRVILPKWPGREGREGICPACTLFGAQGLVGFVRCGFLRSRDGDNRFSGRIRVLWADQSRGWEFGRPRRIGESFVDILDQDGDKLLAVLKDQVSKINSIGAKRRQDGDQAAAVGSLRIIRSEVDEEQRV